MAEMQFMTHDQIVSLLQRFSEEGTVYAPTIVEDQVDFSSRWEAGELVQALKRGNSTLPPKDLFFPQTESIFRFKSKDRDLQIEPADPEEQKFLVFGVRPCDARSINMLDEVFGGPDFEETYYKRRRDNSVLATWTCVEPDQTCFCASLGCGPGEADNADIHFTDVGEGAVVQPKSEKGRQLLQDFGSFREAEVEEVKAAQRVVQKAEEQISLQAPVEGVDDALTDRFEDPVWGEVSASCIGCGICTYLCPTCHCYDLQSEVWGGEGVRYRCWDSCMFSDFTRMAGGENPRPTKRERIRNRYLHKFSYMPDRYGFYGCTGCGRCLAHCPVNIDVIEFLSRAKGVSPSE